MVLQYKDMQKTADHVQSLAFCYFFFGGGGGVDNGSFFKSCFGGGVKTF